MLARLHRLGVRASYSRPHVSDHNAVAEAFFRTAKYRPEFPARGFATLDTARHWAHQCVHWYNFERQHSAMRYVSQAQRQAEEDRLFPAKRHVT